VDDWAVMHLDSYNWEMLARRRMVPFALVGVLVLLTLGVALVGIRDSPSPAQISLQIAAERTAEAPSFRYTLYSQTMSSKFGRALSLGRTYGVWRAPNRWLVRDDHDGISSLSTVTGSLLHVDNGDGLSLNFRIPLSADQPLTDPNSPLLSLPPLGMLASATNVTRNGNVYSFEIPRLETGLGGWVAYAPLSRATIALPLAVALNTPTRVVIKDGYVVSLSFPHGIQILHRGGLRIDSDWHISQIGTAMVNGKAKAG
jgi:hypothetical protein